LNQTDLSWRSLFNLLGFHILIIHYQPVVTIAASWQRITVMLDSCPAEWTTGKLTTWELTLHPNISSSNEKELQTPICSQDMEGDAIFGNCGLRIGLQSNLSVKDTFEIGKLCPRLGGVLNTRVKFNENCQFSSEICI
jgi:hypothetical protein